MNHAQLTAIGNIEAAANNLRTEILRAVPADRQQAALLKLQELTSMAIGGVSESHGKAAG